MRPYNAPVNLIAECRALAPPLLRDGWRQGAPERPGRLLMGVFSLFVGVGLTGLTAVILEVQDAQLRRNLLNMLAALAVFGWLALTVLLRLELSRHLEVRQFLPLPVRFRTLFALRTAFGLSGPWLALFGPMLGYLLVARTIGLVGALVALLATVAVVVLLGRLVALLLGLLGGVNLNWASMLALLAVVLIVAVVFEPVVAARLLDRPEPAAIDEFAGRIRESRLLEAAGHLPGGVLVAVFESPRDLWGNVLRLAVLWGAAAVFTLLDYLLLKNRSQRPKSHSGALMPLAWAFRRVRRLNPAACLGLISVEAPLRLTWMRTFLLLAVGLAAVMQNGRVANLGCGMIMGVVLLNMRANLYGIAHRSLGEMFLLPVRPISHATSGGVALTVVPAGLLAFSVAWALQRLGWPGWPIFLVWMAFCAVLLIGGLGVHMYICVRWPYPYDLGIYATGLPSSIEVLGAGLPLAIFAVGVPMLLELAAGTGPAGETIAATGGVALILASFPACLLLIRAAERRMAADPYRVLETLAKSHGKAGDAGSTG